MPHTRSVTRAALFASFSLIIASSSIGRASEGAAVPHPNLTIVLIIDGLRPDSITPAVMPNLSSVKTQGTFYLHAHSVFPTVTRVNAAAISTGTFPDRNGIVSNSMFVKEVNAHEAFNTGDYQNLRKLAQLNGGRLLSSPTLGELVEKAGLRFVALSSGSTGNALLLDPEAPNGTGVLINGGFEPGKRVALPEAINDVILRRFGGINSDSGFVSVEWTERVLRDYVLPELHPGVVVDWITEPDTAQHKFGVGSEESLATLKKVDEQIGLLLARLRDLHLDASTNIIVVSDHGFSFEPASTNVGAALARAGVAPGEVVTANNGESALLFVKGHNPAIIKRLVSELYKQTGVGVVFTAAQRPSEAGIRCNSDKRTGWVDGTLSLDFIRECNPRTGADILIAMQWSSDRNPFGTIGTHVIATMSEPTGGAASGRSGHGGLSPWSVGTTMILGGPAFKQHAEIAAPAGNQDVMPTLLAAVGVPLNHAIDGRVLKEAFRNGTDLTALTGRTHVIEAGRGSPVRLQYSQILQHIYFDAAWREK